MQKINVSISGMDRAVDSGISTDGQSLELINMRVNNGSLQPVGRPIQEQIFPTGHKPIFVHKNSGFEHYISYDGNNLYYDYDREDGKFTAVGSLFCSFANLNAIEAVGNLLVLLSDDKVGYALWTDSKDKKGKGSYAYIDGRPELPCITFTRDAARTSSLDFSSQYDLPQVGRLPAGWTAEKDWEPYSSYQLDAEGTFAKLKDKLYKENMFYKQVFLRYAIRLVDGSVIMQSPVYSFRYSEQSLGLNGIPSNVKCTANIDGYSILYNVIDAKNIYKWGKMVSSIDIFIAMKESYDATEPYPLVGRYNDEPIHQRLDLKLTKDLSTLFEKVDNFYYVKSLNLEDLTASPMGKLTIPKEILQNIEQQEPMPLDNFSHHKTTGRVAYTYNGRLHLANTRTILFDGFDPRYYQSPICNEPPEKPSGPGDRSSTKGATGEGGDRRPDPTPTEKPSIATRTVSYSGIAAYASINETNGLQKVKSDSVSFTGTDLSPVIIFPDYRAYEMTFRDSSGKGIKVKLRKHPFLNVSYYQEPSLAPIKAESTGIADPGVIKNTIVDSNKVKVSELNDPLVFPARLTYTVSNGDVLALRTASTALSTGQFGQFPLYVFCNDGVYALEVGNEDIVYSRSVAVSREVCNNANAILSTDKAVIFVTESSLLLLNGSETINLSNQIEGYLPTMTDSTPVIQKIANIVNFYGLISDVEFKDFLVDCRLGYNYYDREIIVSNAAYPYSYVYNMASQGWYKTSDRIESFVNTYPECFAFIKDNTGGAIYNMYNPHRTVNNILMISKPIKFGTVTHKRILQTALRAVVRPSKSDVYLRGEHVNFRDRYVDIFSNCGFYVLGSNDAEHFVLISGREKIEDVRDLITKMNKSKAYKYFSVCLAGGVRTDVAFNYFEFILDETYTNRLR